MLAFPSQTPIYVATEYTDFRKGIDGLQQLCKLKINKDPFSGAMFIFCNKRKHSIKILWYDGQGFMLCLKRLSVGRFNWWPSSNKKLYIALAQEAQILLFNGDPSKYNLQSLWKPIVNQATLDDDN